MTHPKTRKMIKDLREGATLTGNGIETAFPPDRIAACMIMGDDYNHQQVIDCINSLKKAGIDKVFIAYNGKTRRSLTWLFRRMGKIGLPFQIQKFAWEDDFAKARNQSFSMVPRDEFDWIMWIDSDDVLVADEPIRDMLLSLDEYTQGVYLRYDYAVDKETGKVAVVQWRERIFTTSVEWTWIYPVHEVVFSPGGTQFARRDGVYIRHCRETASEDKSTRVRNRRIISKALAENPKHLRMQFYFANEAMAEADAAEDNEEKYRLAQAAILAYKRFMSNEDAPIEDLYFSATRVGDLYLMAGEVDQAVDAYLTSIKIIPERQDSYIGLARCAMESEDWHRCKAYANIALGMEMPTTPAAIPSLTFRYTPFLLRGIANEELGLLDQAKSDYEEAASIWTPPNGMLDEKLENIERKLAVTGKDKVERYRLRGTRPEKSIAFVTAPLIEPWHPEIEKVSGAGGAETCIMRLAPRFAADGWRTVVFGTPSPEYKGVDEHGIEWWDSADFLPNEEFTVLVASRIPEVFEAQVASKHKILWMHDVNSGPRLFPFVDRIDRIVGLTNWHANHMSNLYGIHPNKFSVVPNGIELDLYDWDLKTPQDDLRFIWSSSPDRGLDTLIALWPTIKQYYPTSRLDIFYGWNIIDKLIKKRKSSYLLRLKSEILGNIELLGGESAGIFQHGRVPQEELSKWQLNAHIWAYPTEFMETFCITAIEMQAAGVIPVASKLAALTETVANPDLLLVEGWPRNKDYQSRFIEAVANIVEAEEAHQTELQQTGRAFAETFNWDRSYSVWQDLIGTL